jgi:uncharacterized protein
MTKLAISDRRRKIEIGAVLLTAAGKFLFMDWLEWRLPFIFVSILGWTTYVILRTRQLPAILRYWGFRTDNWQRVFRLIVPFGILSVAIFFCIGLYQGTINMNWHIIPILILYPIWGTIQQFLTIALVAGNLKDLQSTMFSKVEIILFTALLFGLMHYPSYWLMVGTFLLALFYGYVYLHTRNLYVMGIFHGWLGGLFFYTVVGRDTFAEVFGKIFP